MHINILWYNQIEIQTFRYHQIDINMIWNHRIDVVSDIGIQNQWRLLSVWFIEFHCQFCYNCITKTQNVFFTECLIHISFSSLFTLMMYTIAGEFMSMNFWWFRLLRFSYPFPFLFQNLSILGQSPINVCFVYHYIINCWFHDNVP